MGLNQLCGGLNTGQHFQTHTWKITSPGKLGLYLLIHHFKLSTHEGKQYTVIVCRRASVHVKIKEINHIFCEHRVPWNISSLSSYTEIKLHLKDKSQQGCYFVMSFEAFDIKASSIGFVEQNVQAEQQVSFSSGECKKCTHYQTFGSK